LDEQAQLGIVRTRRRFSPTANPFYRGFLIAVPAFLLVEICLVGMGLVEKNTRLNFAYRFLGCS
jgi:hypothetical protein